MRKRGWMTTAAVTCALLLAGTTVALAQEEQVEAEAESLRVIETIIGLFDKLDRDYFIDGLEIGFGPFFYRDAAASPADFDGDGSTETVTAELDGLVGTEVTIEVEDGDDAVTVNGNVYRQAGAKPDWAGPPSWAPGPPPWAGSGDGA